MTETHNDASVSCVYTKFSDPSSTLFELSGVNTHIRQTQRDSVAHTVTYPPLLHGWTGRVITHSDNADFTVSSGDYIPYVTSLIAYVVGSPSLLQGSKNPLRQKPTTGGNDNKRCNSVSLFCTIAYVFLFCNISLQSNTALIITSSTFFEPSLALFNCGSRNVQ